MDLMAITMAKGVRAELDQPSSKGSGKWLAVTLKKIGKDPWKIEHGALNRIISQTKGSLAFRSTR
jgi:6-phosphogluconate dehydrogenase